MESADNQLPDVLKYNCPGSYLRDYFTQDPLVKWARPSLRTVAAKAGFRSPSSLSMIVTGKRRLTLASADKLARALRLTGRRRQYFLILAKLDSASSRKERLEAFKKLEQLRNVREETVLDSAEHRLLCLWHLPVIYTLIGNREFSAERLNSKEFLRRISPTQFTSALEDLQKLGLIEWRDGRWHQTKNSLKTEEDTNDETIKRYHEQMLSLARTALNLPSNERDFSGLTVSLPPQKLALVKERIRAFRKEIHEQLGNGDEGEVFQMSIQLFPLTLEQKTYEQSEGARDN